MTRIYCGTFYDLAGWMQDQAEGGSIVSAVLNYEDACKLIHALMRWTEYSKLSMDIHDADYENYDEEYLITIDSDGAELFVERAQINGKYLQFEVDILIAAPYVNSRILRDNKDGFIYGVEAIMEDDEEYGKEDCDYFLMPADSEEESEEEDSNDDEVEMSIDADGEVRTFKLSFADALAFLYAVSQI